MSLLQTWLLEPFEPAFMQRALLATLALAVAGPLAGVWVLSRRLVYLADAMSHALLAGVAAAAIVGSSLLVGGLAAALTMALLVAWLTRRGRVQEDGAIGIAGQGLFALGVLGVAYQQDPRALSHVLFGNPLTVTWTEVQVDLALALAVVVGLVAATPLLIATTFDPQHARAIGIRVGRIDAALLTALAAVVVVGLVSVGVLMAVTLIVAPAIVGRLLSDDLRRVMAVAVVAGVLSGTVGLLIAYHAALPAGPVIALTAIALVLLVGVATRTVDGVRRASVPAAPRPEKASAA
jgi:ABC-type Mn2+/Zn2+ transport system permease subunit